MNWVLVVLILNSPVKTDLSFDSLPSCLRAEEEMRSMWVAVYNDAVNRKRSRETLELVKRQMTMGTCIPAKQ